MKEQEMIIMVILAPVAGIVIYSSPRYPAEPGARYSVADLHLWVPML